MLSFAPIRWERDSVNYQNEVKVSEGGYRMRIMHQIEITEQQENDETIAQKDRPSEIDEQEITVEESGEEETEEEIDDEVVEE